jgi:hypothetical protein
MKRFINLFILAVLTLCTVAAFAADPVTAVPAAPTFLGWFSANENGILKFALSISEFMGLFSAFKGNGLLDTFVKGLQALYDAKNSAAA